MIYEQNFSLKEHNTFGLNAKVAHFIQVETRDELVDFLRHSPLKNQLQLVLGGGSNMLLAKDLGGVVLHINLKGKEVLKETETHVLVEAKAGENWHECVLWALQNNWGGIENLSLIPGNIGTAPVQNIGAYGVELKDVFHHLEAVEIETGNACTFLKEDCHFGYRESIFKNDQKGKFIITAVCLKLTKAPHNISTRYGDILKELESKNISTPTIADVSNAVIKIRQSKLPDPAEIGNSGSFFKNPILPESQALALKEKHPEIPVYPTEPDFCKVAAGWLIEQAGWKGYRIGDAGIHKNQALVLVNYGHASGQELIDLAHQVIASVNEKFGVKLSPEVNIIGE